MGGMAIDYWEKIKALEFTLEADDKVEWNKLKEADIILLGVSCTAKTPLALSLAYRGYKTANIPLVPEMNLDLDRLLLYQKKLVVLTIEKKSLQKIRKDRLNSLGLSVNSVYSSLERINKEFFYTEEVINSLKCPVLDVTGQKVEGLASKIIRLLKK